MINIHRAVLVPPDSHATTALTAVWGMGGRVMDLPKAYQNLALADLQALKVWPEALIRAHRQLNPQGEDGSCS